MTKISYKQLGTLLERAFKSIGYDTKKRIEISFTTNNTKELEVFLNDFISCARDGSHYSLNIEYLQNDKKIICSISDTKESYSFTNIGDESEAGNMKKVQEQYEEL